MSYEIKGNSSKANILCKILLGFFWMCKVNNGVLYDLHLFTTFYSKIYSLFQIYSKGIRDQPFLSRGRILHSEKRIDLTKSS